MLFFWPQHFCIFIDFASNYIVAVLLLANLLRRVMELNRTVLLTSLLPSSSYTLAYTLPLLLSSLCLTFAGAFLTLDRSRSFPPKYDSIPGDFIAQKRPRKFHWLLEGGIGGLASGYVFGGA